MNPSARDGAWLASMAAVLALAGAVRVANFRSVLLQGELLPQLDGDSSYHLHRIEETLRSFPHVPHFDPGVNWPSGAFGPWADGFDLSAASFALLAGGHDPARQRLAVALWPVILGLLVVAATIRLTRSVAPGRSWRGAALAAGLVSSLMPILLVNSRFGRIDHHVVEALALTLLATWALGRFPDHPASLPPEPLRFEVEGALVSGMAVWTFSGSPLYVALAAIPLAWAAFRHGGRVFGSGGPGLVVGGLLSAALSIPAVVDIGRLVSFKFPSLLQPMLLVAAGLAVAGCGWAGHADPGRTGPRLAAATGLLAVALAVVAVLAPGAVSEVEAAISGWLLHRDAWLATVSEFKPLIRSDGPDGLYFGHARHALTWLGLASPLAIAAVATALRGRARARWLAFLAAAILALALVQNRFARVAVPLLGAVIGLALAAGVRWLGRGRHRLAWVAAPALVLGALLSDFPVRYLLNESSTSAMEPVIEVALDLRDQPPPPELPRGVLTNWSYGHHVQVLSGLPVVVNGFGSYLDERAFWAAVEVFRGAGEPFDRYLQANRVGVVVAGAATLGNEVAGADDSPTFSRGVLNQPYMASVPLSPLLIAGSAVPNWNVPHLPHLMPRAASLGVVAGLAFPLPFLWSYERVPGTTVSGRAPAGQRVVAELGFTERARPHTYKAYADAGQDGRWSMVLPFPTGLLRPTIRSDARWRVAAAGGKPVEFALPEPMVRTGGSLDVGALAGKP